MRLTPEWREVVGAALVEKLLRLGAQLLALSMSGQHCHFLAKMPPGEIPRKWTGQAKKHAHFIANEKDWKGALWAVRSKVTPIKDRPHQLNAFDYILRHANEGAWVWDFRKHKPVQESPGTAVPGLSTTAHPAPIVNPMLPQLLAELVQRPSVNPMGRTDLDPSIVYEGRVTALLEHELRNIGCAFRRQRVAEGRDNLIATYTPPHPVPFGVLFEAHQDTVPVDGMIVEPFGATVEGGKLYGRGACDVKAGVAVMLAALARLVKEKPAGSAQVTVAVTVDEEHGGTGIQALMQSGLRADYAIVAEPTLLNIVNAHKGVARWSLETTGRACHSSRPDQGVSAVYRMARLLRGIEEYARQLQSLPPDPVLGPRTISVGRVTGGVSPNTVPDFCRADIDRRLVPGETYDTATADLDASLRARPDVDFPFTLARGSAGCLPLGPELSVELVERFGAVIDAVAGAHTVHPVPFGTDAATVAAAGVPVIVFGPGDIAQAHTKDEWIDLSQLEPAAEILFRFACGK